MRPVVAYMRFSSENQDQNSIEMQRTAITRYAAENDLEIIQEFVDEARTGREDDREQFLRMCQLLLRKKTISAEAIIIYKFSRFFRDMNLWALYESKLDLAGIKVISVTEQVSKDPSQAKFQKGIIRLFDQYASDTIGVLVKDGMFEIVRNGYWPGGIAPYGYRIVHVDNREGDTSRGEVVKRATLVPNEPEAKYVRRAFEIAAETTKGAPLIWRQLVTENGGIPVPGRYGTPLGPTGLRFVLIDPIYKGEFAYNKTEQKKVLDFGNENKVSSSKKVRRPRKEWLVVQNEDWRLVSNDLWNKVQDQRKINQTRYAHRTDTKRPAYLLTGLATCSKCKGAFSGRWFNSKSDSSKDYYYYRCRKSFDGAAMCANPVKIRGIEFERAVVNHVVSSFLDDDFVMLVAKETLEFLAGARKSRLDASELHSRDAELAQQQSRLLELFEKVGGDVTGVAERLRTLEAERAGIKRTLATINDEVELPGLQEMERRVRPELKDLRAMFQSALDKDDLRCLLRRWIEPIRIDPDGKVWVKMQPEAMFQLLRLDPAVLTDVKATRRIDEYRGLKRLQEWHRLVVQADFAVFRPAKAA